MKHIFNQGKEGSKVFVALHGTGGDETNLLPVTKMLNEDYSVLSIRGNINENGANRYFRRKEEGVYDLEDLKFRGKELQDFIIESASEYDFSIEDVILVGFSNGSNIAINMLLREDSSFKTALLFAPLYPVDVSDNHKDMSDVEIFTSMGEQDPIVPISGSKKVISIFEERGADVEVFWTHTHELNGEILRNAKEWLNKKV